MFHAIPSRYHHCSLLELPAGISHMSRRQFYMYFVLTHYRLVFSIHRIHILSRCLQSFAVTMIPGGCLRRRPRECFIINFQWNMAPFGICHLQSTHLFRCQQSFAAALIMLIPTGLLPCAAGRYVSHVYATNFNRTLHHWYFHSWNTLLSRCQQLLGVVMIPAGCLRGHSQACFINDF